MPGPAVYVVALALTLTIETPLYAVGLAFGRGTYMRAGGRTGAAVNLVSHPLAFLVAFPMLGSFLGPLAALVAVEIGVVYLEAALVWHRRNTGLLQALFVSGVANVASLAIGLALLH